MKKILVEKIARIIKNHRKLEKILNLKITNRGREVFLDGEGGDEYLGGKVVEALDFGFPFSSAVAIKKEEMEFEVINIKDHTKRNDLKTIRARLIGRSGKALKTLSNLTDCFIELKDNKISIIGFPESIESARMAIILIIQGSKHSNAYKFLEKHRPEEILDLGLK